MSLLVARAGLVQGGGTTLAGACLLEALHGPRTRAAEVGTQPTPGRAGRLPARVLTLFRAILRELTPKRWRTREVEA